MTALWHHYYWNCFTTGCGHQKVKQGPANRSVVRQLGTAAENDKNRTRNQKESLEGQDMQLPFAHLVQ